ncbi:tyrosine-protein kinase family protein [Sphingomonas xinjiangensis]|uniref:Mrp family chromosome partitioning ATPase n=1 Tax=Sphingomonas xinjiangensis TaxID=643568 RepID=A0A840YNZ6_9SPHN|nr:hypothetical protein [Sphingomonas xinjiangensis]MBB5712166.1 Mrp family chromosome partitioning ATPase [Sphingomonas xinjiangensis]
MLGDVSPVGSSARDSSGIDSALLPEQRALVLQLQQSTGKSFQDCAMELGYLPGETYKNVKTFSARGVGSGTDQDLNPLVVMMSQPDDPVARAARELRAAFGSMQNRDGTTPRRYALLALRARTENSIIAANLAVACALSGQRTLLIDANFKNPVQHGIFHRAGGHGVSQLLAKKADLDQLIQATDVEGLSLLPIGTANSITAELTDRAALATSTERASETFDAVIVDVGEADQVGIACAQGFDAVLLLVQRDVAPLGDARRIFEKLRGTGEASFGLVVID